jgi:L-rhamnonate dehydratase
MTETLKITDVHTYPLRFSGDSSNAFPVTCPMSVYPEYRASRLSWRDDFGPLLIRISTNAGIEGIGYTSMGGVACALTIELHLKRLLLGENPLRTERINDILIRSTYHQGRDGFLMHAISAIDLALWDIRGQHANMPVYALLGGTLRDSTPCYMTGYDTGKVKESRFAGIKLPLKYGPASGHWGLDQNVQDVARVREALGKEPFIMLDCWMGLDVPYTIALTKALRDYHVLWLEEPLVAGDIEGYRQLRRAVGSELWITCGEHETLTRGAAPFFKERLVDVWQADVTWAGGITSMQKIAAMAQDAGIAIIPHYSYIPWAAHFVMACPASPMIEWYDLTQEFPGGVPLYTGDMTLRDGHLYPGSTPGFGVTINWDVVEQNLDKRVSFHV